MVLAGTPGLQIITWKNESGEITQKQPRKQAHDKLENHQNFKLGDTNLQKTVCPGFVMGKKLRGQDLLHLIHCSGFSPLGPGFVLASLHPLLASWKVKGYTARSGGIPSRPWGFRGGGFRTGVSSSPKWWRYPFLSCKAYEREKPPPKMTENKFQYLHFWYPESFGDPASGIEANG